LNCGLSTDFSVQL